MYVLSCLCDAVVPARVKQRAGRADFAMKALEALHPNIQVMRHPDHAGGELTVSCNDPVALSNR